MEDIVTKLAPTVKKLYFLSRTELGIYILSDTEDGLHPNNTGMKKWADAYLKIIEKENIN